MKCFSVMYSSRWYTLRSTAMIRIRVATPEKMAPATKNAPNIVLFHGTRSVMAKIHDTTVCTETAIGMIRIIATPWGPPGGAPQRAPLGGVPLPADRQHIVQPRFPCRHPAAEPVAEERQVRDHGQEQVGDAGSDVRRDGQHVPDDRRLPAAVD